jgi:hypothetical protein
MKYGKIEIWQKEINKPRMVLWAPRGERKAQGAGLRHKV